MVEHTGVVAGLKEELGATQEELAAVQTSMASVTAEGKPTHLLPLSSRILHTVCTIAHARATALFLMMNDLYQATITMYTVH